MKTSKLGYLISGGAIITTLASCSTQRIEQAKPNVLVVVFDDLGFSDLQPFGGEINTPNINALAEQGKMFSRFHTSPLSAPARSLLLTGVDNHTNGLGNMPPAHSSNQYMQPGYEGHLTENVMTIPEILSARGYYTCMSGKWHLGFNEYDPIHRGFQDSFVLIGGGASHFSNGFALSEDEEPVTFYTENGEVVEELPDDFYSSKNYADKMITYIENCPNDKPLFGYLAFTSGHDPLHIPAEWADKYKGCYDEGYDAIREARYERLRAKGMISPQTKMNYSSDSAQEWEALSEVERREQSRKMEIYAAMIEYMDMSLGRVIEQLKISGRYDNTLIIMMTDNGANPREAWDYPGGSKEAIDTMYDNSIENMGSATSYVSLGQSWAEICNTPYSLFKHTTMEGGICTPLIVSGRGMESGAMDRHNVLHVTDILPTILEYVGCERPTHNKGVELAPLYGKSLMGILTTNGNGSLRGEDEALCFEICEFKAVIKGDWKAVQLALPYGDGQSWQLYNLDNDLIEKIDLSEENPQKLNEMVAEWESYKGEVGYIEDNGEPMLNRLSDGKLFYTYDVSLLEGDQAPN